MYFGGNGPDLTESRLMGMTEQTQGGLVAVGLRSIAAVPHEVQRQRGTQGLLVQRETMASQPSVTAAEQLTMTGGGLKRGVKSHTGYWAPPRGREWAETLWP